MLRSMMHSYVQDSNKAVELYQKAFEDAKVGNVHRNEDGTFMHVEIDIYGQIFSISESKWSSEVPYQNHKYSVSFTPDAERNPGNTMQFCLHFGPGNIDKIHKAYEVLKEGAFILYPLGPVFFSSCMFGLIDKFGVNWCLFE